MKAASARITTPAPTRDLLIFLDMPALGIQYAGGGGQGSGIYGSAHRRPPGLADRGRLAHRCDPFGPLKTVEWSRGSTSGDPTTYGVIAATAVASSTRAQGGSALMSNATRREVLRLGGAAAASVLLAPAARAAAWKKI